MMKTIVVCSAGEWESYGEAVLKYADSEGITISGMVCLNHQIPKDCVIPQTDAELLLKEKAERIIFLSIYNFSAATYVYRTGIRNIAVYHTDGCFISSENEEKALQMEHKYIDSQNYSGLKQLNRINMLLSYFHRESVLRSYPLDIQIESTSYCNAECIMCGHYVYKNAIAKHIPEKLTGDLNKYLMYAENVILHGNGEPFLQPDIKKITEYYGSFEVKLITNTNLSILDRELAESIKTHFREITVSVDGCTKEVYENIRLNLRFEKLIENLNLLNSIAPEVPKKIAVVAARQNLHQLPDFINFAKEHGFYAVNIIAMGSSEIVGNKFDEPENFPAFTSLQLKKTAALAEKSGIAVELPYHLILPYEESDEQIKTELEKMQSEPMFPGREKGRELFEKFVKPRIEALKNENRDNICFSDITSSQITTEQVSLASGSSCCGVCDSVMARPFVMLEGKLSTCCLKPKFYLGKIEDSESLGRIWNSPEIVKLREQFYSGIIPEYCVGCSFMNNHFLKLGNFDTGG